MTAAELAGRITGDLDRTGQPIGRADPMIAAIAIVNGLELVAGNTAHYQRISGTMGLGTRPARCRRARPPREPGHWQSPHLPRPEMSFAGVRLRSDSNETRELNLSSRLSSKWTSAGAPSMTCSKPGIAGVSSSATFVPLKTPSFSKSVWSRTRDGSRFSGNCPAACLWQHGSRMAFCA